MLSLATRWRHSSVVYNALSMCWYSTRRTSWRRRKRFVTDALSVSQFVCLSVSLLVPRPVMNNVQMCWYSTRRTSWRRRKRFVTDALSVCLSVSQCQSSSSSSSDEQCTPAAGGLVRSLSSVERRRLVSDDKAILSWSITRHIRCWNVDLIPLRCGRIWRARAVHIVWGVQEIFWCHLIKRRTVSLAVALHTSQSAWDLADNSIELCIQPWLPAHLHHRFPI